MRLLRTGVSVFAVTMHLWYEPKTVPMVAAFSLFITSDNVEFNLRADHGLHELIKDWLLDSRLLLPFLLINVD